MSWLRDFVPYEGDAGGLADRLTRTGLEVDEILRPGDSFTGITVGEVLDVRQHPNADKLTVCQVTLGGDPISVVCGAPNVAAGQRVPFAEVGAVLPGGMKLKKAKIRGEVSHGMICSEAELELGEDAAGIMVLPDDAPVGTPFAEYQGLDEEILEIEVTPNRPDALSIYGVAREVAALFELPLEPYVAEVVEAGAPASGQISVAVDDPEGCPRYSARLIRGVRTGSSPAWMSARLIAVGLRPINVIVDITNYIMMEVGQPQHAFDLKKVERGAIVVRRAREGEALRTLDDEVKTLDAEVLLITDGDTPLAVAGVMGGLDSEISADTTDILLESAHFDPLRVSIGGGRVGLVTESRKRFERGTDPTIAGVAADRAAALMAELAGGEVAPGIVEFIAPGAVEPRRVSVSKPWVDGLLGVEIPEAEANGILSRLGFEVAGTDGEGNWDVVVPPWRPDVEGEAYVAEELARIFGYDELGSDPTLSGRAPAGPTLRQGLREDLRDALVQLGFHEVTTNSLVEKDSSHPFLPGASPVLLENPQSEDCSEFRRDLLPGVLSAMTYNLRRQMEDVRVFEIGMVHRVEEGRAVEEEWVVGALTGARMSEVWHDPDARVDWFDLFGIITALARSLYLDTPMALPYDGPALADSAGAKLSIGGEGEAGFAGMLETGIAQALGLVEPVWVFGLRLGELEGRRRLVGRYEGLPRHPASDRDVSVIVPDNVPIGGILDRLGTEKRVERVKLKEEYTGEQIPAGKRSILLTVRYRDAGNTLSDSEIDGLHKKTVKILESDFGAQLRG